MKNIKIIAILLIMRETSYCQDRLKYNWRRGDEFLHFRLDSKIGVKDSSDLNEIFSQKYKNNNNSFILYCMHNLWKEDPCGTKEYRMNIVNYIGMFEYMKFLTIHDIENIFGAPDSIRALKNKNKYIDYIYNIHFNDECSNLYYWAVFMFSDSVLSQTNIMSNINEY